MTRANSFSLILFYVFLMTFAVNGFASQVLDDTESAIVTWSESHRGDAIDLLEKLVNINSGSLNQQGVKDVGAVLRAELDGLDFETR